LLDTPISFAGLHTRLGEQWHAALDELRHEKAVLLAVSGGADSLAMLAGFGLLHHAGLTSADIQVATVNHGLRPEAAEEVALVQRVAAMLGLPCSVKTLERPKSGGNTQAWARGQRYAFLADVAAANAAVVLTAHTADDQAETLLMRAARGTGSEGLAGIRQEGFVCGVRVLRPFLSWPREQLHQALSDLGLEAAFDPSNDDPSYTRVRFRNWLADAPQPDSARSVAQGLAQTARIAALESEALDSVAASHFAAFDSRSRCLVSGSCALCSEPVAIVARVLRLVLLGVARHRQARDKLSLARLVDLATLVQTQPQGRHVVAGAVLEWTTNAKSTKVLAYGEAGRDGFPVLDVQPSTQALWDERFHVRNATAHTVKVRAWTAADADDRDFDAPNHVLATCAIALNAATGEQFAGPGWSIGGVEIHAALQQNGYESGLSHTLRRFA
jgi:tRNA(Ile)-lysidine synthase